MKIDNYELFEKNKNTLKELSKDDNGNNIIQYMVGLEDLAVDFDKVKTIYANSYGKTEEVLNSVDAIISIKDKTIFIEFKNGNAKLKRDNIKKKIYSSLLIFSDITGKNLSYIRKNIDFILVYNDSKTKINNYISKKGNEKNINFGLDMYKEIFFKNVYTYSVNEFEDFINKNSK